ncbi:MAG: NAD(P)H-dependent oxidoreductase [Acidimicrobiaceae bacterium]|nr:NAD(P)H-dependent oxidoreductase [Acidimicrobiaceae bacterium]MBO0746936.1 NAD(P)H-dependent oxidoreductase [Acidimicrobiaceae bacterium]
MSVAVVVGNPRPESRTLRAAVAVADALKPVTGDEGRLVVDLATLGGALLDWEAAEVSELNAAVAGSDLVIVASPTYKATFTGVLKLFLDRYGNNGLAGTVAVPVMTGASPIHALAPEVSLRPLLVELGASVPTRGLFVLESSFDDLPTAVGPWAEVASPQLARALAR